MTAQLKLAFKLPAMVMAIALLTGASLFIAAYMASNAIVAEQADSRLRAAAANAHMGLEAYLNEVAQDLTLFAGRREIAASIDQFTGAMRSLRGQGDPTQLLQEAYLGANPHPADEREAMDTSERLSVYDMQHRALHADFRQLRRQRGYADILLFDSDATNVYSVAKQADFGTSFAVDGGPWAGSDLGRVVRAALAAAPGEVFISDFAAYGPSNGAPASFLAAPVHDQGFLVGAIVYQMSTARIGAVLQRTSGLGASGEIYLVGQDGLARNDAAQAGDGEALTLRGDAVATALAGEAASGAIAHHQGESYGAAAEPLSFAGVDWAVVALESADEITAPSVGLRNTMLAIGAVLLAVAALASLIFARTVTRPITRLTTAMAALASDRFDIAVPGLERADELGAMAEAVDVFRANGLKMADLRAAERDLSAETASRAQLVHGLQQDISAVVGAAIEGDFSRRLDTGLEDAELRQLASNVNDLLDSVERGLAETGAVLSALARADLSKRMEGHHRGAFARLQADTNGVAEQLSAVITGLRRTSGALRTATGEILAGANDLSERTTRQASTIEQTSAAMEQLNRTVSDNAAHAAEASGKARAVSADAQARGTVMDEARAAMERITHASGKISNITGLIDDIAFQTNLLALNASVEAARAGEAGKGFAVVAVEVRRLAQSAANASADIKGLVESSVREVAGGARLVADAAGQLVSVQGAIGDNADLLDTIARASREQAAAIEEVNVAMRQLDQMTQHNAALVEQTNAAIAQTEARASEMDGVISGFTLAGEKAAPTLRRAG